jgi:hypothetical protein
VSRVRRTHNGELLLELSKDSSVKSDDFKAAVAKSLGDKATVKHLSHVITIECRDMDEITEPIEICKALEEQFSIEDIELKDIRNMRKTFRGTQAAEFDLPAEAAKRVLSSGKIKIGWSVCRLRERFQPKRCFRCMNFGHWARDCTGVDRSRQCRRCGLEGHLAATCTGVRKCLICNDKETTASDHITGSSRCPEYRRALSIVKKT